MILPQQEKSSSSKVLPQKPHDKQPKLSKAEGFLILFSVFTVLVLYCQSCYSLAGMDALRNNKSENDVLKDEKLAKARVVKQQKYDKPEPVLLEKLTKTDQENRLLWFDC